MSARRPRRWSWLVLAGYMLAAGAWAQSLNIIDLKYRTAADVIPVLEPLLEQGGSLSGQDYKLFVRASARNVAQLQAVLAQIDRQPRELEVSVRRGTRQEIERERAAAAATVRAGAGAVSVNERQRSGSAATVQATRSSESAAGGGIARVRLTEGGSALIANGTSVPVVTAVAAEVGRKSSLAGIVAYRELRSGFMVTPRVRGTEVILDIAERHEELRGSQIESQNLSTQVSGRLGEWLLLGAVSESVTAASSGILRREYATSSDERATWVKVEAL